MTDFGLAVAKTQQAVGNEPQAIQMIKKIKESNEGRRLVCDCFGLYGFYSSLDLFPISSFGFRILPWHLWQGNRESAAPIEGARYRDISAMGSGDGAG
jgi:hypothetical protein